MYFAVEFPWQAGEKAAAIQAYDFLPMVTGQLVMEFGLPLVAAGLALWNWRIGRADVRGAMTLGGAMFAMWAVRWALMAHHADHPDEIPASYRQHGASGVVQAADYVAGMTDRYALATYARIFGADAAAAIGLPGA